MSTPKSNFRLSQLTRAQLAELSQLLDLNMTEVVKIAIDRLYQDEINKRKLTVARLDKSKVYKNLSIIHPLDKAPMRLSRVYWSGEEWHGCADGETGSDFEIYDHEPLLVISD